MAIAFSVPSALTVSGTLTASTALVVGGSTTLSALSASTLVYLNASKVAASVTLNANVTLTAGTLALNTSLTSINSITSAAASALTLATGSFGTSVTIASATGIPTFATGAVFTGGLSGITTLAASGVVTLTNTTEVGAGTGALVVSGGVYVTKAVSIASTTASTTASTGALVVAGGLGISLATDASSSTNGGSFTTAGGAAIAKKLYVGTDAAIGSNLTAGGTISFTAAAGTAPAGGIALSAIYGLNLKAYTGSSYDFTLFETDGGVIFSIPTGTGNISFPQTTEATTSAAGALILSGGLYAAKKIVGMSDLILGGATSSITLGTATEVGSISVSAAGALSITPKSGQAIALAGNVTVSGTIVQVTGANGGLELGAVGSTNTPLIDFHSSASSTDYDVRLISSGGTASDGAGTLTINAAETSTPGFVRLTNTTEASDVTGTTGSVGTLGGLSVAKSGYFGGIIYRNETASISAVETKKGIAGYGTYTVSGGGTAIALSLSTTVTSNSASNYHYGIVNSSAYYGAYPAPVYLHVNGFEFHGTDGLDLLYGTQNTINLGPEAISAGVIGSLYGTSLQIARFDGSATVTNAYGSYVSGIGSFVTNGYGLYLADVLATNAWSIYTGAGIARFGDTTDATDSTGTTGALRSLGGASFAKSGYFGGTLTVSGTGTHTFGTTNTVKITAGAITGTEISDPSAPAANSGTLYFKDNGAGKTQLVALFPTGAVQVIATEP